MKTKEYIHPRVVKTCVAELGDAQEGSLEKLNQIIF